MSFEDRLSTILEGELTPVDLQWERHESNLAWDQEEEEERKLEYQLLAAAEREQINKKLEEPKEQEQANMEWSFNAPDTLRSILDVAMRRYVLSSASTIADIYHKLDEHKKTQVRKQLSGVASLDDTDGRARLRRQHWELNRPAGTGGSHEV